MLPLLLTILSLLPVRTVDDPLSSPVIHHFTAGGITGREQTGKFGLSGPFFVVPVRSFMQQQN